jgi:signal peptidase II
MPNDSQSSAPATAGRSGLWWLWLSLVAVVLDQASKLWIIDNLTMNDNISVLSVFNITHVHNHGAAFSFLSDAGGWQRWFLTAIAVAISVMLLWWMKGIDKSNKLLGSAYALILGGALGNVYDRIAYGYVEDFIHFFYQSYSFPAFNIADSAITLGAMLLIYDALTGHSDKQSNEEVSSG